MATNTPMILSRISQNGLLEFQKQCYTTFGSQWNIREQMRQIDLDYMRERDLTNEHQKAKFSNKYGDSTKFQNITIPVVLPVIEAAVVYQSSVFLSGSPIFGVVSNPKFQDAAMQMEALMENHAIKGGWIRHLQMFLRDGFKYNFSAIDTSWLQKVTATLESDPTFASGKQGKPKEVVWEGNVLNRLDPYNTFFDATVPITQISEYGEFAGWTERKSRIALKAYIATLPNKMVDNLVAAFESGGGGTGASSDTSASYYIPPINPNALTNSPQPGVTNWLAWAGVSQADTKIKYQNSYDLTTLYARIIPSDFAMRVPSPNTPQVWKLVYVNHQVLIYAERQTNAHGLIPILFGQPLEDGLSYQTKPLSQNVSPIQSLTSAMMNSVIAARRRAISDRGLFDPSRVGEAQINSDNPSAKIPVRPAAYGKPLGEAYYPIPFRDDQSGLIMQEMGALIKLSDIISGQNPARQGQFVKGNKTRDEFSDVMAHSNGRDQNTSLLLEAQVFTPMKEILKLNILQYQGPSSLYYRGSRDKSTEVKIEPLKLREAVIEFKVSDGLTPTSKLINSDSFQTALQVIGSSPQIGSSYNIGPMFSYLMKTQGAHIGDFEKTDEQVAYEQALSSWNQMAQLSLSKGLEWKQPQPTPEQFGYLQEGSLQSTKPTPEPGPLDSFLSTLQTTAAQNGQGAPQ